MIIGEMDLRRHDVKHALTKRFVLAETILLVTLCTWDTLYTLICVRLGFAHEENPMLKGTIAHSDMAFLLVKGATFLVPVFVLELIRCIRPRLVTNVMRFVFVAYALIYTVGSIVASKAL